MDVTTQVSAEKPVFTDISNEVYRTYYFPTGRVTINNPVKLNVKRKPEGDSHRIVDDKGTAYYVPAGWLLLEWRGKDGEAFSF